MKRIRTVLTAIAVAFFEPLYRGLSNYMMRSGLMLGAVYNQMQLTQEAPDLAQFVQSFVVFGQGQNVELIDQPLYDRLQYPTAGGNLFQFFATGVGSGLSSESSAGAGVAKSFADTNLQGTGGQLPSPQAFWAKNMQIDFDPGSVSTASTYTNLVPTFYNATGAATIQAGMNDKQAVLNAGYGSLDVGEKNYFRGAPLRTFPPEANFRADGSVASAGTNAQPNMAGFELLRSEGVPGMGGLRILVPGVGLPTSMNFKVVAVFPIAIATPSGFNGRLQCRLGGWQLRAIQ